MKERPILMSTENVKAILEGRKTQTRRVVKPQPKLIHEIFPYQGDVYVQTELLERDKNLLNGCIKFPYGQVGDKLWVRETWNIFPLFYDGYNGGYEVEEAYKTIPQNKPEEKHCILYRASHSDCNELWRPSIFMPRWASRITLEITEIRVQRVQEISPQDAHAEGCPYDMHGFRSEQRPWFWELWDSLNEKRGYGWSVNPWVWAVSFKMLKDKDEGR